jgi:hypothetical protein
MPLESAGGYSVVIDPGQWYLLKQQLDAFDPELARALRRRIKNAGDTAAEKVRETLRIPPPTSGPDDTGGRDALAAATRVTVSFSKRSAGARIATSARGLRNEHKGLLNVYNKKSFRHPVFADDNENRDEWTWVTQEGRPYFGSVILKAMNDAVAAEIFDAIDDALKAIDAQGTP